MKLKIFLIILLSFTLSHQAWAKVDPPNYNFSIDLFQNFMPSSKKEIIEEKFGKGDLFFKSANFETYRYYLTHLRYRFAIFVQYENNQVLDFHASLPTYFLHDIFHQSLINRIGKQDFYKNSKEQSIYIWHNKNNARHIYSGACTITCFPIYYAVMPADYKDKLGYKPIFELLQY